jgi:hypothetical protein
VFDLCKELGIDDPIAWFNAAPEKVVDAWIAHASLKVDEQNTASDAKMMSPAEAFKKLNKTYG